MVSSKFSLKAIHWNSYISLGKFPRFPVEDRNRLQVLLEPSRERFLEAGESSMEGHWNLMKPFMMLWFVYGYIMLYQFDSICRRFRSNYEIMWCYGCIWYTYIYIYINHSKKNIKKNAWDPTMQLCRKVITVNKPFMMRWWKHHQDEVFHETYKDLTGQVVGGEEHGRVQLQKRSSDIKVLQ